MGTKLEGRTALVTGSSRGIGAAIALRLAEEGCDVAINYHANREAAESVAGAVRELGRRAEIYQGDVTSFEDATRVTESAVQDFGSIGILVNNGGTGASTIGLPSIVDTTPEQFQTLLGQHVLGSFYFSKLLIPQMRALSRGDIIMISSVATQRLGPRFGAYNAAKSGMEALAHTIAKEEKAHNIRANIVAPGMVDTEMGFNLVRQMRGAKTMRDMDATAPFGFVCTPRDVANAVVFLCSEEGRYITDLRLAVDGGP